MSKVNGRPAPLGPRRARNPVYCLLILLPILLAGCDRIFEPDEPDGPTPLAPTSLRIWSIVARWNDGKFVKLGREDAVFLDELLDQLRRQLDALHSVPRVIAAIHHLPFAELLPPRHGSQWDFARAYLGSPRIGELLLNYPNITDVFCGHSHLAAEARIGSLNAINIGSGYRFKTYRMLEL